MTAKVTVKLPARGSVATTGRVVRTGAAQVHTKGNVAAKTQPIRSGASAIRNPMSTPVNMLTSEQALLTTNVGSPWVTTVQCSWYCMGHVGLEPVTIGGRAALRVWTPHGVAPMLQPASYQSQRNFAVTPGKTYTFRVSFWNNSTFTYNKLRIIWYDSSNARLSASESIVNNPAVGRWIDQFVTGVAPANAAYCRPTAFGMPPVSPVANLLTSQACDAEDGSTRGFDGLQVQMDAGIKGYNTTAEARVGTRSIAAQFANTFNVLGGGWHVCTPDGVMRWTFWYSAKHNSAVARNLQWWQNFYDEEYVPSGGGYGSANSIPPGAAWTDTNATPNAPGANPTARYRQIGFGYAGGDAAYTETLWVDRRGIMVWSSGITYQDPVPGTWFAISQPGFYERDETRFIAPGDGWAPNLLPAEPASMETNNNTVTNQRISSWQRGSAGTVVAWDTRPNIGTHNINLTGTTNTSNVWTFPVNASGAGLRWPAVPGRAYSLVASIRQIVTLYLHTQQYVELRLEFRNAADAIVQQSSNYSYPTDFSRYFVYAHQFIAPANTTQLSFLIQSVAATSVTNNWLLDSVALYEGHVGAFTHPDTPRPQNVPVRIPSVATPTDAVDDAVVVKGFQAVTGIHYGEANYGSNKFGGSRTPVPQVAAATIHEGSVPP